MNVFLSEIAEEKLLELSNYLVEKWNRKARDKFLEKFTESVKQISLLPNSCPQSNEFKGLYKCVVTKHITFYYRISIELNEIEIITVFDTRQNPNKLIEDIT